MEIQYEGHTVTTVKYLFFLFAAVLLISCGDGKLQQAQAVAEKFGTENFPDKRETVFEAEVVKQNRKLVLRGETTNSELKDKLLAEMEPFNVIDEMILLPDTSAAEKPFALVNLSAANLRHLPDHPSELVTQALAGTPLRILSRTNGWYRVQTPDRYISWVDAGGIHPVTTAELEQWKQAERIIYTGNYTMVYDMKDQTSPVADITMGGILELVGKHGNELKVRLPDGRVGFTADENWQSFSGFRSRGISNTGSLINLALLLNGRPYLWGGTSAVAMDCSGFTKMVYFMHGLIIARDASLQVMHGKTVEIDASYEQLQPGDLLFFGRAANEGQSERITHVGISLGNKEYIHAAGMVTVNSFDPESEVYSEYRKSTFIRARRIIGTEGSLGTVLVKEHPWY
jgi:gamma-D-glutamyl-L-lysine dipeptidyl-peptidase